MAVGQRPHQRVGHRIGDHRDEHGQAGQPGRQAQDLHVIEEQKRLEGPVFQALGNLAHAEEQFDTEGEPGTLPRARVSGVGLAHRTATILPVWLSSAIDA